MNEHDQLLYQVEFGNGSSTPPPELAEACETSKQLLEQRAVKKKTAVRINKAIQPPWSHFLMFWLSVSIGFQFLLALATGTSVLNFANHESFLIIIALTNFIQIIGMGYVAVKYLFFDAD